MIQEPEFVHTISLQPCALPSQLRGPGSGKGPSDIRGCRARHPRCSPEGDGNAIQQMLPEVALLRIVGRNQQWPAPVPAQASQGAAQLCFASSTTGTGCRIDITSSAAACCVHVGHGSAVASAGAILCLVPIPQPDKRWLTVRLRSKVRRARAHRGHFSQLHHPPAPSVLLPASSCSSSPQGPHANAPPVPGSPRDGHHCSCLLVSCGPKATC